ncbi:MAG: hypothetical protein Q9164_005592 [Protoblastenia rupestris]
MVVVTTLPSAEGLKVDEIDYDEQMGPFSIGSHRYMALPPSKSFHTNYQGPPSYATVIFLDQRTHKVTETWLRKTLAAYRSTDDVFQDDFLSGVIFTRVKSPPSSPSLDISPSAYKLLESLGTKWLETIDNGFADDLPSAGPYFVARHKLREIVRLYDDVQGAFIQSLIPLPQLKVEELFVEGSYAQSLSIAVPSRLRHETTAARPLAGLRVAVKDIFQIQGICTTVCNRAYYELYSAATKTAACIEILRQLGANIVGTTKLASFAATEEPIECVDFQAPWNPRADGYQSPAGSSSGSGAAIASYDWLDIAIGSDSKLFPQEFD